MDDDAFEDYFESRIIFSSSLSLSPELSPLFEKCIKKKNLLRIRRFYQRIYQTQVFIRTFCIFNFLFTLLGIGLEDDLREKLEINGENFVYSGILPLVF